MAAKTFEEFWEIVAVPHSRQGNDYVFAKELTRLTWAAAIKAAEEKFTAEHNVPALAPTTRPAVKLPSTEDVWNYVYNHHEFCEDFARENEARDISKLVYEFIYRQLQA
jgi:hypothetical protein